MDDHIRPLIEDGKKLNAQFGEGSFQFPEEWREHAATRPMLDAGAQLVYEAFTHLSTERPIGFGVGLIPWGSMKDWCMIRGIEHRAMEHFINVLMLVDGAYVVRMNRKKESPEQ